MSSATPSSGRMKPMSNPRPEPAPLVAFGCHPDDVEFGCGGIVALESRAGRACCVVVCSRGESASHGTPEERLEECRAGARALGASLELIELDGDSHLEEKAAHSIRLAGVIRRLRPATVLAPTPVENQHPDHYRLGRLVRDAARIARFGGVAELRELRPTRSSSSSSTRRRRGPSPARSRRSSSTCRPRRSWPPGPPRWRPTRRR